MKTKVIVLLFCLITGLSYAQSRQIFGKVVDKTNGNPLAFATVIAMESENGTSADKNGDFSIRLKKSEKYLKLSVSNIGYQTRKIPVQGEKNLTVKLSPLIEKLDEVSIIRPKNEKRHRVNSFRLGKKIGIGNFSGGKYPSMVARYYKRPEGFDLSRSVF